MLLKYRLQIIIILVLLGLILDSCKKRDDMNLIENDPINHEATPYELKYPFYFPKLYIPEKNPQTEEGVILGRKLYYDPKLSMGGPKEGLSCSSCHFQSSSFTVNTGGTAILPHINLGWARSFLWEGKIQGTLEDIMRFEVEEFFQSDMNILQGDTFYPKLYYDAFGSYEITKEKTAFALAQFFRILKSTNSKFDQFRREEINLSASEMRGYQIFFQEKGDCFHCHSTPLYSDNDFHNIGLDTVFYGKNRGRSNITGMNSDLGKFKTPTLRNIELTAPYMHDGRFSTLEEVIEHYNSGVRHSNALDPIMTKPGKEYGLQLTEMDKKDLVAFLKTLTDTTFIYNPELSSPF